MAKRHPTFREALGVLGAARDPMASMALARPPTRSEIKRLRAINAELVAALEACRSALDCLMGDSDLPEDDSPEMKAMQMASAAIARAKP